MTAVIWGPLLPATLEEQQWFPLLQLQTHVSGPLHQKPRGMDLKGSGLLEPLGGMPSAPGHLKSALGPW